MRLWCRSTAQCVPARVRNDLRAGRRDNRSRRTAALLKNSITETEKELRHKELQTSKRETAT